MILVDTSAWIEYDRATGSPFHLRVRGLIESGEDHAATEPVLMEVLSGARSEPDAARLRRLLVSASWLGVQQHDFDSAAAIYRACREAGYEPSGSIDCLVAAVALRFDVSVLAAYGDFKRILSVVPLRLDHYN